MRPPPIAEWIVRSSLREDDRETVLGDLAEEFASLVEALGPRAARRWYWRQTAISFWPNLRRLGSRSPRRAERRESGGTMEALLQDVRYGWRMIRRRPIVTSVALASLVTGIALSTVVFSLLNAVVFRPIALANPDELSIVLEVRPSGLNHNLSYPDFVDYRTAQRTFSDLAAYSMVEVNVSRQAGSRIVAGELVSGGYFPMLGVRMRAGRHLADGDDRPGAAPVAIVSESLWRQVTGREIDAGFTPQSVTLNRQDFSIVGVVAAPFAGMQIGRAAHVWAPIHLQPILDPSGGVSFVARRTTSWLTVIGRRRAGVTEEAAATDLARIDAALAPSVGRAQGRHFALAPGRQGDSNLPRTAGSPLLLLLGAAGLVLLVACANVANLLLARATERAREMAVRSALGARATRLARLVLVEASIIGLAGAAMAFGAARWLAELVVPFMSSYGEPVTLDMSVDWRLLAFVTGVAMTATLLSAIAPVVGALRVSTAGALGEGGRSASTGPAAARVRRGLIVVQFALSLALVVAASLLARTVYNLRTLTTGFDIDHVALIGVDPEAAQYDEARSRSYLATAMTRLEGLPGVRAVGFGRVIPLGFGGSRSTVIVPGYQPTENEDMELNFNRVSPGYFEAMGIRLVAGRWFADHDTSDRPAVVVVNQTMAERFWPGTSAVGQRIRMSRDGPDIEVVGVAADVKYRLLREESRPSFYEPLAQGRAGAGVLHVRSHGDPRALLDTVRQTLAQLDPAVPMTTTRTLRDQASLNLNDERLAMIIAVTLGGAALLLAAVGLYGSMSYAVSQRTRELGVRVALGASARDIRRLVLGQGLALCVAGTLIGTGLAIVAGRAIESRLFGISPADAPTLVMSASILAAVAILASWIPAWRATRVDPVNALRVE